MGFEAVFLSWFELRRAKVMGNSQQDYDFMKQTGGDDDSRGGEYEICQHDTSMIPAALLLSC